MKPWILNMNRTNPIFQFWRRGIGLECIFIDMQIYANFRYTKFHHKFRVGVVRGVKDKSNAVGCGDEKLMQHIGKYWETQLSLTRNLKMSVFGRWYIRTSGGCNWVRFTCLWPLWPYQLETCHENSIIENLHIDENIHQTGYALSKGKSQGVVLFILSIHDWKYQTP